MNSKTFIVAVLIINLVLSSYLEIKSSESKKINNLTSDTIIVDTNVLVFWNRVIHEWFDDNSQSAMNLLTGTVVNEHDANKDIQMRDSSGARVNFFLRSGDQAIRIPGSRTLFGQFIAYDNMTEAEFDTLSKITNLGSTLEPSDFYRVSTAEYSPSYINAPLTQNTVYSFYLVDKSTTTNIYGMIRLRSAFIQGGEFNLAVDVKLNIAGQNKFNRVDIER